MKDSVLLAYENLANGIVLKAYKDFVHAIKYNQKINRRRLLEFFHSSWYRTLTTIPCEKLIEQAYKEAEEVSMSQVKICDVCGEQIKDSDKSYTIVSRDISKERVEQYDMCSACFDKFLMEVHKHD